jgi:gamma-D-glutamyl-L-lysine dipeptidyl-peptidase
MDRKAFFKKTCQVGLVSIGGLAIFSEIPTYAEPKAMKFGVSDLSLVPVRKEPSERSEMVTQALFGEHYKILEQIEGWVKIKISFDGYEGWISHRAMNIVPQEYYNLLENSTPAILQNLICRVRKISDNSLFYIVAGSVLPSYNPAEKTIQLSGQLFKIEDDIIVSGTPKNVRDKIVTDAHRFVHSPYLWGGRSAFGVDCSGLTQTVFRLSNINLPRDAHDQALKGTLVGSIDKARPGDLAFFGNKEGKIIHTGIIAGNGFIIHSTGRVRIDKIDQIGIIDQETKGRLHKLSVIRSFI